MVVRREGGQLRRYCHLGTGNYHSRTAMLYTDFGLLTCDEDICADVNDVFMQLTSLGKAGKLRHLWQSPFTLHHAAHRRDPARNRAGQSRKEGRHHRQDECAARAGDHRRAVRSLQGRREDRSHRARRVRAAARRARAVGEHPRALDHRPLPRASSRLLLRQHAKTSISSSADWMDRNFFRRIEVVFPCSTRSSRSA